jgi:hypothetical protein
MCTLRHTSRELRASRCRVGSPVGATISVAVSFSSSIEVSKSEQRRTATGTWSEEIEIRPFTRPQSSGVPGGLDSLSTLDCTKYVEADPTILIHLSEDRQQQNETRHGQHKPCHLLKNRLAQFISIRWSTSQCADHLRQICCKYGPVLVRPPPQSSPIFAD